MNEFQELLGKLTRVEIIENEKLSGITQTRNDSFGNPLWTVEYIRLGKKETRSFPSEEAALAFQKVSHLLADEPRAQPRKHRGRSREIPKW